MNLPSLPPISPSQTPDTHTAEPPATTWGLTFDALLKHPDALLEKIASGGRASPTRRLWAVSFLGMLLYGVVVGLFAGGQQLWAVPVKLSLALLFSAAICWPSLYILVCLGGGSQSPGQITGLLGGALALMSTLLVGFAPVAWVFTQSTGTLAFMGVLHLALWGVCCLFALRRLGEGLQCLNRGAVQTLPLWNIVFFVVCLQMTTALRPLLGPFDGWHLAPRQFFLQHWTEQPGTPSSVRR